MRPLRVETAIVQSSPVSTETRGFPLKLFNLVLELKLSKEEKADLVAFLRCL